MSQTPMILSSRAAVHMSPRGSSKVQPERIVLDPLCSPHAFEVLDVVWNALHVPAFKPPGNSMLAVSGAHLRLTDAVVDQFLDAKQVIVKGMEGERKFILFNVNTFSGYSGDIEDGGLSEVEEHGTLGLIHIANGDLLLIGNCTATHYRASQTLFDRYTKDLSLVKLLMLVSGERLIHVDDDGEIIGLSLFDIKDDEAE